MASQLALPVRRILAGLIATASTALAAVVALGWERSYRPGDRISRAVGGDRYTLCSESGRITLFGPPKGGASPQTRREIGETASRVRNQQLSCLGWEGLEFYEYGVGRPEQKGGAGPIAPDPHTPADQIDNGYAIADTARPLLAALEDPDRFVAAHLLLCRRVPGPWNGEAGQWQYFHAGFPSFNSAADLARDAGPALRRRALIDGVELELWPRERIFVNLPQARLQAMQVTSGTGIRRPVTDTTYIRFVAAADPAGMAAVRDRWHRRLDVPVASVPHRALAGACLTPVGIVGARWLGRHGRRRFRRRRGWCVACGYDLTATPDRCPECGASLAKATPSTAALDTGPT